MSRASALLLLLGGLLAVREPALAQPPLTDTQLLDEVQRRACRFFREKADPTTGLVNDRARNTGSDDYTVASIASTGYALAAMPVAVERKWEPRADALRRAVRTLRFVLERMPHEHGWLYHFVDRRDGQRAWNSEISSIDTALLVLGARVCARYFRDPALSRLADSLYARMDWAWMRTNGGTKPDKQTLSMGWTPEKGWIPSEWSAYCEGPLLYLLGMGAPRAPLPPASWDAWTRNGYRYGDVETLAGGPIFMHQMIHGFFPLKDRRDRAGYDYWVCSVNATHIHRQFCMDRAGQRKTYGPNGWGLNASDGPKGYMAYGVPEPEDGTVSPTGALASLLFAPQESLAAASAMYRRQGAKLWGRYGFGDAYNVDADWYDPDVIGIDLGMVLLAIENHRTGLIWRLMAADPLMRRAYAAAGLRVTREAAPRLLRRPGE